MLDVLPGDRISRDVRMYTCIYDNESCTRLQNYTIRDPSVILTFFIYRDEATDISVHRPMVVQNHVTAAQHKAVHIKAERNLLGQLLVLSQEENISFLQIIHISTVTSSVVCCYC